jgi:hypothetical protein
MVKPTPHVVCLIYSDGCCRNYYKSQLTPQWRNSAIIKVLKTVGSLHQKSPMSILIGLFIIERDPQRSHTEIKLVFTDPDSTPHSFLVIYVHFGRNSRSARHALGVELYLGRA